MSDVYKCPMCNDIRVYLTDSYAKQERAAIVAWLNRLADPCGVIVIDIDDIELIERGEHVKKTGRTLHDDETCKGSCHNERHILGKQPADTTHMEIREASKQALDLDKVKTKLQNVRNERDIMREQRDAHKDNAAELVEKLHKIGQKRPWDVHKGRTLERSAIVAWLRQEAEVLLDLEDDVIQDEASALKRYAGAIERGEHLKSDDDEV